MPLSGILQIGDDCLYKLFIIEASTRSRIRGSLPIPAGDIDRVSYHFTCEQGRLCEIVDQSQNYRGKIEE